MFPEGRVGLLPVPGTSVWSSQVRHNFLEGFHGGSRLPGWKVQASQGPHMLTAVDPVERQLLHKLILCSSRVHETHSGAIRKSHNYILISDATSFEYTCSN
jgi:hypothetical protein